MVIWDARPKLRDDLLVNSEQFEGKYNQLRIALQSFLGANKTWALGDFGNEAKTESPDSGAGPMDNEHISREGKSKDKGKDRDQGNGIRQKAKAEAKAKATAKSKGTEEDSDRQATDKASYTCGNNGHIARDCWPRHARHRERRVNEVAKQEADQSGEFVFAVGNSINDVTVNQSGCGVRNAGWVMIDSGASASVCPMCFANIVIGPNPSEGRASLEAAKWTRRKKRHARTLGGATKRCDEPVQD